MKKGFIIKTICFFITFLFLSNRFCYSGPLDFCDIYKDMHFLDLAQKYLTKGTKFIKLLDMNESKSVQTIERIEIKPYDNGYWKGFDLFINGDKINLNNLYLNYKDNLFFNLAIKINCDAETLKKQLYPEFVKFPLPIITRWSGDYKQIRGYYEFSVRAITNEIIEINGFVDPDDDHQVYQISDRVSINKNIATYKPDSCPVIFTLKNNGTITVKDNLKCPRYSNKSKTFSGEYKKIKN